jgi:hypothetical protein
MKILLLLALAIGSMALPLRAADPHAIEGMWQLVAASPVAPADVDPHGMVNQKLYFSKDGKIFLLRPDEKLSADVPSATYEFDGKMRKVTLPDGNVRNDPAKVTGDTLSVTMPDGQQLTYRRITGADADQRTFAPMSVEVVANGKPPAPEPKYDESDHSQQPLAERLRGVWEVVRYAKVSGDVPPHGFANDKYVIDDQQIAVIAPEAKSADRKLPYRILGDSLVLGDATWSVTFNRWQQLVLTREDAEVTLRLIQKSTTSVPAIPTKIALVE